MLNIKPTRTATPYVLRTGEGRCFNVAGQLIYVLAGESDTAGGFGAVICDATTDRGPIPKHYHEREHDTWLCTRGRLQVWFNDECRTLTDGDFAYVRPGDVHSYQSVAPRTQFFGIVAPGGWEEFFADAGEDWTRPCLPALSHPFDFSRMRPAMVKHDVHPIPNPTYPEPTNGDATDRILPSGPASYALQAGHGPRRKLNGHLSTLLLSRQITSDTIEMRSIEGGRRAEMPTLRHEKTHVLLYLLEGTVRLALNGEEHLLTRGDTANIPAGVGYATRIESTQARWALSSAHGNGLSFWDAAGTETQEFVYDDDVGTEACANRIRNLSALDVAVVD